MTDEQRKMCLECARICRAQGNAEAAETWEKRAKGELEFSLDEVYGLLHSKEIQ